MRLAMNAYERWCFQHFDQEASRYLVLVVETCTSDRPALLAGRVVIDGGPLALGLAGRLS